MNTALMPSSLQMYQFAGLCPGPRLIILGAVHGNETCGTQAIERVRDAFSQGDLRLERGTLTLVPVTNPLAYENQRRHGERNLNRNMGVTAEPLDFEDRVAQVLCGWLKSHDVLLDLHSFHTPGEPFALLGPANNSGPIEPFAKAEAEESLVLRLGVKRFVEGWLDTYAQGVHDRQARGAQADVDYGVGTTESMRRFGGIAITLECGQHDDPQAPQVAYQAILSTLAHLGLIAQPDPVPESEPEVIRLYQVIDKLHSDDHFARDWQSFEPITAGEVLAYRQDGTPLSAEFDGWIVFPNPAALVDQEWFYLARTSDRLRGKG